MLGTSHPHRYGNSGNTPFLPLCLHGSRLASWGNARSPAADSGRNHEERCSGWHCGHGRPRTRAHHTHYAEESWTDHADLGVSSCSSSEPVCEDSTRSRNFDHGCSGDALGEWSKLCLERNNCHRTLPHYAWGLVVMSIHDMDTHKEHGKTRTKKRWGKRTHLGRGLERKTQSDDKRRVH